MANFFTGYCANGLQSDTQVTDLLFGLCDDATKPTDPAYVSMDAAAATSWIARVDNSAGFTVTFKPVDHCIPVLKGNGKLQQRCDGILLYNTTIVFVELKERKDPGKQWANEGANQLKQTMKDFAQAHGTAGKTIRAYVANRIQPNAQQSHVSVISNFTKATKVVLRVEGTIVL